MEGVTKKQKTSGAPLGGWLLFVIIGGATLAGCFSAPPVGIIGLVAMFFLWKTASRVEALEEEVHDLRAGRQGPDLDALRRDLDLPRRRDEDD